MKKYIIEVFRTLEVLESGDFKVEAESLEDAKKKGLKMLAEEPPDDMHYALGDTLSVMSGWEIDQDHTKEVKA